MIRKLRNKIRKKYINQIDPDEIFMDSSNLPGFDNYQFEGRIEKPISKTSFVFLTSIFLLVVLVFTGRAWNIQVMQGEKFASWSENNKLRATLLFSDRGLIYDINDKPLVWNEYRDNLFNTRKYIEDMGLSSVLGYVSYPKTDSAGFFYDESTVGISGVEKYFDKFLSGKNGERIVEVNAVNEILSENVVSRPINGENIIITIDSDVQKAFHESIKKIVNDVGFSGGGGVIMNIHNGDLLALVSYPEYNSNVLTDGKDVNLINKYIQDIRNPFLNKITEGNYTPGSIIKPFIALAALQERVISPTERLISRGTLVVPNIYNPDKPSVFTDWKAHGSVNIREALAYSSNIYFYIVGGGYDDLPGLGITKINEYLDKFGFGQRINNDIWGGGSGTVPSPAWKKEVFDDDWRLGDTYFTAIGQYGFQVVPIQVVRAVAGIASKGRLVDPNIIANNHQSIGVKQIDGIDDWVYEVVQAGMRDAVEFGTAKGLFYEDFQIAAKTGTAELGSTRQKVNSWAVGYWPYQDPQYAFVILLEQGDRSNLIGGIAVARNFFDWLKFHKPEYTK